MVRPIRLAVPRLFFFQNVSGMSLSCLRSLFVQGSSDVASFTTTDFNFVSIELKDESFVPS